MNRRSLLVPLVLALILVTPACTSKHGSSSATGDGNAPTAAASTYTPSPGTLNIVAGSEQQGVLDQIVLPWCTAHSMTCRYKLMGSVDQARLLASGKAPYDAFWFASSVFQQLGDQHHALESVKPMFVTPVVFAGWKSHMQQLGFTAKDVTIQDVLSAVETKKTRTWVTNPTQSNSGATVLLGYLNYFAGNGPGRPLTAAQLASPQVQTGITRFVRAFDQTPPSSGTLMKQCVAQSERCQTLFTYEDLVIEQNEALARQGHEPLYAVYPQGSLAISDAPLGFFPHGSNPDKLKNFQALQDYLLGQEASAKLLALGRRPSSSIGLSLANAPQAVFNPDWGIKANLNEQPITYPAAAVIQAALDNYQLGYRNPTDDIYCLDGSGSMGDNGGWSGVKAAAGLLFDPAQAQQYLLQVHPQDRTTVIIFNAGVKAGPWTVTGNAPADLLGLKAKIQSASPSGDTGLYHCISTAAQLFRKLPANGHKRLLTVMTDGQDTEGDADAALAAITALHVPALTIGFGDSADEGTLTDIATRTGGTYIPAGSDLVTALRQATGFK